MFNNKHGQFHFTGSVFLAFELKTAKIIKEASETPVILNDFYEKRLTFIAGGDKNLAAELAKLYSETGENALLKGLVNLKSDISMKCGINQYIEEARKRGGTVYHFEFDYRC